MGILARRTSQVNEINGGNIIKNIGGGKQTLMLLYSDTLIYSIIPLFKRHSIYQT